MALAMAPAGAVASSRSGAPSEIAGRLAQDALVVGREPRRSRLRANRSTLTAARRAAWPVIKKRIRPQRLDRVDERPYRGLVGAGHEAHDGREVVVSPALELFRRFP